jgi:threonine synthase
MLAPCTRSTGEINLACHPRADPFFVGRFCNLADEFVPGRAREAVVSTLKLQIRRTNSTNEQANSCESFGHTRQGKATELHTARFQMNGKHRLKLRDMASATQTAAAELVCFNEGCRARYAITEVLYNCPQCGGLVEATYGDPLGDPKDLKKLFRERRTNNAPLDQSGVWRYRELSPFLDDYRHVVTLREGNTPLLDGPIAAKYGGLDRITFKHQGFNPTGSFKDNGMTCGASQAVRLGMKRVACVSTGNTSASMAAYAAAAGLEALIFLPHGNISFGKLAQALEYGAKTLQVEANFDQILALVRVLAERLGIYLLNSMNPFRIEGQKAIMFEMLDQRDWRVPDWVVLPGGNLGNTSAFGKGLREAKAAGLIDKLPRLAVIQAEGSAPFYELWTRETSGKGGGLCPVSKPETLATAIRIGDPVSWPKALHEVRTSGGTVEKVTEQEIADAKAQIGLCGIGCEPASAATLAGIRKLTASGVIDRSADVVAVLTGNLLKDSDYIYRYHTGQLEAPGGVKIQSTFGNKALIVPNDPDKIAELLA